MQHVTRCSIPKADDQIADALEVRRRREEGEIRLSGVLGLLAALVVVAGCAPVAARTSAESTAPSQIVAPDNTVPARRLLPTASTVAQGNAPSTTAGPGPTTSATAVVFTATPPSTTHVRYAEFSFQGDGPHECRLDGAPFTLCSSPLSLADVGSGDHSFAVRSVGTTATSTYDWTVTSVFDEELDGLLPATRTPAAAEPNSWRGIFRINCDLSHSSYNDPIVFPGQADAAHLHNFYGSVTVDHTTTVSSLATSGESTCQGNELNRSAYWVPALLSPTRDRSSWNVVPAVVGDDDEAHEIFYYSAAVDDLESVRPIPAGLRMIAGDATATPGNPQSMSIVRWHCQSWGSSDARNPRFSATIPACAAPDRVRMDVFFPSCWNGVDLDAADHRSHMAYPVRSGRATVCPATHPVPIVRPSYHYAFGVKPAVYDASTRASVGWRLASDNYTVTSTTPGGASLHADWFNGWHPEVMEAIVEHCIRKALDCHDGNLANGFRLSGVQAGIKNTPEIVNDGLGHAHHTGGR